MLAVDILHVSSEDYDRIVEIHNLSFSNHICRYGKFSGIRKLTVSDLREWSLDSFFGSKCLLKAQVRGDILGYCCVKKEFARVGHLRRMGDSCSILCIVPSWRRKGIGSTLLANAEGFLRSKGFALVVTWVYKSDLPAREFLEKAGYKHRREFFVDEFSNTLPLNADVEFWRKDLDGKIVPDGVDLPLDCIVRPHRNRDEIHLANIYNRVWGPYCRQIISADQAKKRIKSKQIEEVFFAELKGKPVGCTEVNKDGSINLIGVIPEYQRKGVGTILLSKTLEYLKLKGHNESYMGTGIPLRGALSLYRKLGYEKVEELHCMAKEIT